MYTRGGSTTFFRRGCTLLLLYFNTSKPHTFFFCRIPVVLENRRSSRGGGGGGGAHPLRTPCTLPLDLPLLRLGNWLNKIWPINSNSCPLVTQIIQKSSVSIHLFWKLFIYSIFIYIKLHVIRWKEGWEKKGCQKKRTESPINLVCKSLTRLFLSLNI